MGYCVLTIGLSDEVFSELQVLLGSVNLCLTPSLTVKDASRLLNQQIFHLLIVDLEYLRSIEQTDWLTGIRRISFLPVIVVSDTPEQDMRPMVQLGADICVSGKRSCSVIADLAFAQLRRYTEYNHYRTPGGAGNIPFRVGDFYIDPARHAVEVRGQPVNLRPREFSLLLYFMRNPNIVLTSEQICENAWGLEYTQSVFQSIHDLRKQIEPNTGKSCYIKTVYRVGYWFTGHFSEVCDD